MAQHKRDFRLHGGRQGTALAVRVTPRARRTELAGVTENGTLKVRLTAPPVEGKANRALIVFLAKVFDVPKSRIEIVAGHTSLDKIVSILDISAAEADLRIKALLAGKK